MLNSKKIKPLVIIFLLTSFFNKQIRSQCHLDDWSALKALYESTSADNWSNNTGWKEMISDYDSPQEDCNLTYVYGVELDNNGRVKFLNLSDNQLNGTIPLELVKLNNLKELCLHKNQLSGSIPKQLGKLKNLLELNLRSNQLNSGIPSELGNLNNLTKLYLNDNQLSGSIPSELGNLSNLRELYLSNNQLNGCYEVNLLNLSAGTNSSVSDGNSFDATWEEFRYNLDGSGACSIPDYGNCYYKDSIVLTTLKLKTTDEVILNGYGCVTSLELSHYHYGNISPEIGNLSNLTYLDLSGNDFSGSIPVELSKLSNLTYLDLGRNELTDSIPVELGNLCKLTVLDLNGNQLSGSIPHELSNLNSLIDLDLRWNKLSGSIPTELVNLSDLKYLRLMDNQLNGSIPNILGNLGKLTSLDLSSNQLSGNIPPELSNLDNLADLDLGSNQLSGNIPPELGNLSNLTDLRLSGNQLNGNIPPELGNLSNLIDLWLSGNQLNGAIPPELGNLNKLTKLRLNSNELIGSVPPELGNLSNLTVLDLSSNQLSGSLPAVLGSLINLIDLDLSSNQLSGNIPAKFGDLNKLKWLYLNDNQLNGIYPSELLGLCDQLSNYNLKIDEFNNFEIAWDKFCTWGDYVYSNVCNLEDWTALKVLYESANGDNWTHYSGWETLFHNQNTPPPNCNLRTLYGVELDSFRVIKLNLANNELSGSLPTELGNLSKLTSLKLDGNQLNGSLPTELDKLSNLTFLKLDDNEFSGNLLPEFGNLSKLTYLNLSGNQLSGELPVELSNLSKMKSLYLDNNQLSGIYPSKLFSLCDQLSKFSKIDEFNNFEITWDKFCTWGNYAYENVCNFDDWTALKALYESTDGDNWINRSGWEKLFDNESSPPSNCNLRTLYGIELDSFRVTTLNLDRNELNGSLPPELGKLSKLTVLKLWTNQLSGSLPTELGDLSNLTVLELNDNQLSGSLPTELGKLSNLTDLKLNKNKLSGTVPPFSTNIKRLVLSHNFFDCADINTHFDHNDQITAFIYHPQYFTPLMYENLQSTVITPLSFSQPLTLSVVLPWEAEDDFKYRWWRNKTDEFDYSWWGGEEIFTNIAFETNEASYTVDNFLPTNAGKYNLEIGTENCLSNGRYFEMISEPIYVIAKGYDLFGQPVEYDQIMVQFDSPEDTKENVDEILNPNAGWVKKACNCNRELYLWQFPSTEDAAKALVEIDKKFKKGKKKSAIKGGFNNRLNVGDKSNSANSFNLLTDSLGQSNLDSAIVYLLDSGLDRQNFNASPFLLNEAPIDSCYSIESDSAYAFMDTDTIIPVSANYKDENWHGTYGFRTITDNLTQNHKIKIVPLKIFNEHGEGNLFDLTCALYHAIDHNADVINISAGFSGEPSNILENAILLAKEKEIFITTAAGNDTINIDSLPQYPAYYANKYNTIEIIDENRTIEINTLQYDHVISVVSLDEFDSISEFSNYGKQSATLAAYGENIHSYGLEGLDVVASGTSMATYLVTKELALEIASNRNRTQKQIWNNFKQNRLLSNNSIGTLTSTGMQLDVELEEAVIYGCNDPNSCNYFEYVTIDDGTCEYNSCKCVYADWVALKDLYQSTQGDNWKKNENWDILELNTIPSNCNFDDLYGVQLNENGRVTEINLYNNNLSGNIPKGIKGLTALNSLYLAANNLVGEIPEEFGDLVYLENLILSANNLSGPIPIQLGALTNLKRLYLSYNNLNGVIPVHLNQLNNLEYILLNNNDLEGSLSINFELLNNLYLLNISNNQLSGCYESELAMLCNKIWSSHFKGNANISDGNNFDVSWENFCLNAEDSCLSIKNSNLEPVEFQVYPNPSSGRITIEFLCIDCKSKALNVLNLEGKNLHQVVASTLSNKSLEIDLSEFSKGIYFIELKTEHNNYIQKFILK